MTGLLLPFRFDTALLRSDLRKVDASEWTPHYNERDYGGDWSGVALRSHSGRIADLVTAPADGPVFMETPLLERCPYFKEILSRFACPLNSVRLLSLAPQSFIREHSDHALGFEDGEVRIHVPIQTSNDVEFYLDGERLDLQEGCSYYINVNLPHRVNNHGLDPRIHLVIDAEVNEWVEELFTTHASSIPVRDPPAKGFAAFRALILSDAKMQATLLSLGTRPELIGEVVEQGKRHGFQFTPADVEASRAPLSDASTLDGHLPVKIAGGRVEWVRFGETRLTEPFFDDSVRSCLRNPYTSLFRQQTPLSELEEMDGIEPSGFIFHMSRCGSTLVSQMLAALPDALVISEAPAINDILQAGLADPAVWLRRMVRAFGCDRAGARMFVKLDAWLIYKLPVFRAAFPDTPWIFLHRDPAEVIASQMRAPGVHCAPGAMADPAILQLTFEDIAGLTREQWCARVIGGIFDAAMRNRDDARGLFVDYADLPGAMFTRIAPHFGLKLPATDIERMRQVTRRHSKTGLPWSNPKEDLAPVHPVQD